MLIAWLTIGCTPLATPQEGEPDGTSVRFETADHGAFTFELFTTQAPLTAANFLTYVEDGFYDGTDGAGTTIFHRFSPGFVLQGGGFTPDGVEKSTRSAITNEARTTGLSNVRGTLSMARTDAANSATSQFFVNLDDNLFLDPGESTNAGYAVFGQLTAESMDRLDQVLAEAEVVGETPVDPLIVDRVEAMDIAP